MTIPKAAISAASTLVATLAGRLCWLSADMFLPLSREVEE